MQQAVPTMLAQAPGEKSSMCHCVYSHYQRMPLLQTVSDSHLGSSFVPACGNTWSAAQSVLHGAAQHNKRDPGLLKNCTSSLCTIHLLGWPLIFIHECGGGAYASRLTLRPAALPRRGLRCLGLLVPWTWTSQPTPAHAKRR